MFSADNAAHSNRIYHTPLSTTSFSSGSAIASNLQSESCSAVMTFTTGPSYLVFNAYINDAKAMRPTNGTHAQLKFCGVTW
jgi:hypothetical protein